MIFTRFCLLQGSLCRRCGCDWSTSRLHSHSVWMMRQRTSCGRLSSAERGRCSSTSCQNHAHLSLSLIALTSLIRRQAFALSRYLEKILRSHKNPSQNILFRKCSYGCSSGDHKVGCVEMSTNVASWICFELIICI